MVFTYRLWCVTGGGESLASRQPGGGSDPGIEGAASRAVRRGGPSEAPRERFARGASMRIARRADRACRLRAAWRLKRGAGNYSELVGAVWHPRACSSTSPCPGVARRKFGLTQKITAGVQARRPRISCTSYRRRGLPCFALS
ncbi:hypothetical protein WS67_00975 [Burkholderia singularis]|uniref:Uncharacterized protein n=1 Tax=Burkholderia singularis TaxID=1503053 RepID=A0A103DWR2_9BURK|nr:hypothetical protein WS67_00975 [Burkholderia singularis]